MALPLRGSSTNSSKQLGLLRTMEQLMDANEALLRENQQLRELVDLRDNDSTREGRKGESEGIEEWKEKERRLVEKFGQVISRMQVEIAKLHQDASSRSLLLQLSHMQEDASLLQRLRQIADIKRAVQEASPRSQGVDLWQEEGVTSMRGRRDLANPLIRDRKEGKNATPDERRRRE